MGQKVFLVLRVAEQKRTFGPAGNLFFPPTFLFFLNPGYTDCIEPLEGT